MPHGSLRYLPHDLLWVQDELELQSLPPRFEAMENRESGRYRPLHCLGSRLTRTGWPLSNT